MEAQLSYSFEGLRTGGRRKQQSSTLIQSPGVPSPTIGHVGQDTGAAACAPTPGGVQNLRAAGTWVQGCLEAKRNFDMDFSRDWISI